MPLSTATKPFSTKATSDWQLGEIAAIEGREPYPVPADLHNTSAWLSGYHSAYNKIHGQPWVPPLPKDLPGDAIVLFRESIIASHIHTIGVNLQLRNILAEYASLHGVTDSKMIESVDFTCCGDQGTFVVGYGFTIRIRNPLDRQKPIMVFISLNHLKGEFDLRPKLDESKFIKELKFVNEFNDRIKAEEKRRIDCANALGSELTRVFGSEWSVSFSLTGPADIMSIQCFGPSNSQVESMTKLLKTLPNMES